MRHDVQLQLKETLQSHAVNQDWSLGTNRNNHFIILPHQPSSRAVKWWDHPGQYWPEGAQPSLTQLPLVGTHGLHPDYRAGSQAWQSPVVYTDGPLAGRRVMSFCLVPQPLTIPQIQLNPMCPQPEQSAQNPELHLGITDWRDGGGRAVFLHSYYYIN